MTKSASKTSLPPIPKELAEEVADILNVGMNAPGVTAFDQLACAYRAIDLLNTFISTLVVCKKGCSACCTYDVNISRLEAEYISINTGARLDIGDSKSVMVRRPCTFLGDDGACTIYDSRPLNCRTFHTLDDPKYCETPWVIHQVYGSAGSGYGNVFYAKIADWLVRFHRERGIPYRDIRDWLPAR